MNTEKKEILEYNKEIEAEIDSVINKLEEIDLSDNKDLADNKKVVYNSTDTKGYNDIKPDGLKTSDVTVDIDEKVAIDIATELENNKIFEFKKHKIK